jgi:threonine/homoserine/homoserine lactone efflux protein
MMTSELTFLFSGIVFGLSAGLSPGPLLTLVISETLKHGVTAGVKVALAPFMTDLPISLAAVFLLSRVSNLPPVIGFIFLCGAVFLVYLGYESLCFNGANIADTDKAKAQSLKKGVIANFLNPSPYLFWISIGSPTVMKAMNVGIASVLLFLGGFYLLLVGSKILIAVIIGKSRFFLKSRNYIYTIRLLGVMLLIFAAFFFKDSLKNFGLI